MNTFKPQSSVNSTGRGFIAPVKKKIGDRKITPVNPTTGGVGAATQNFKGGLMAASAISPAQPSPAPFNDGPDYMRGGPVPLGQVIDPKSFAINRTQTPVPAAGPAVMPIDDGSGYAGGGFVPLPVAKDPVAKRPLLDQTQGLSGSGEAAASSAVQSPY